MGTLPFRERRDADWERLSEAQARSCSRLQKTELSSYKQEENRKTGLCSSRFVGGEHGLYLFCYELTRWHVGSVAPLKTESQHSNHMLFLTQSVDPGHRWKEWALSVLPYGLMRFTTYTMASLRKVYWVG
jgi:hypothetical protein